MNEAGPYRREDPGASFAGRTAARPGRPPVLAVVFLIALASLFVAGLGGRVTSAGPMLVRGEPAARPPSPVVDYGWPPSRLLGAAFVPVRFERPSGRAGALTGEAVDVEGRLRIHADSVRVSLKTLDLVTLDAAVVDTSNPDGGIRPVHGPAFDVQLQLPTPRPTGERLWIIVTVYDEAGALLGVVRRIVTIGARAS